MSLPGHLCETLSRPVRPVSEHEGVTVVIPCRNEAGSLAAVLAAIPDDYASLVVDNGSDDGTAAVALEHGARVVYERTPGYGAAVQAGVVASLTPIVCVLDGDGSLDPAELPMLVELIRAGADLAVGRRRPVGRSGWPLHARAGNAVIAARHRCHSRHSQRHLVVPGDPGPTIGLSVGTLDPGGPGESTDRGTRRDLSTADRGKIEGVRFRPG